MGKPIRIAISGASGFLGINLCYFLSKENTELVTFVRDETEVEIQKKLKGISTTILLDEYLARVINPETLHDIDFVIHLASYAPAQHSAGDLDQLIDSNIRLGLHLADTAVRVGAKFLNIGTNWQHFEGRSYSPVSLYAATKQAMQDLLEYYSQVEGLSLIQLDLSDTYGVNDSRNKLIPQLIEASQSGKHVNLTDGTQLIDLVNIEDILKAIWTIINNWENHIEIGKFSISSESLLKVSDLVEHFESIFDCNLSKTWGAIPGHRRQMKKSMAAHPLPLGWKASISIEAGLRQLKNATNKLN